jgi:hypothetical protein
MTGLLACVCTCVDFICEIFSRASFPARRLLRLLLQPVILEKTTAAEKEQLLADYEDRLASYESQFRAYMT